MDSSNGTKSLGKTKFGKKRARVEIPELAGAFNVKALTVGQLNAIKQTDDPNNNAIQLALALIDDDGNLLYDVNNPSDIADLNDMPISVWKPLIDALNDLHGTTKETVDEIKKN